MYSHQNPELGQDEEPNFTGRRTEVFRSVPPYMYTTHADENHSKYLTWHVRRQLAFDIWPLALAVFLICCAERGKLMNTDTYAWFTVFRILFDATSAYSTIGLSLGTVNNNYSFSGELGTVSKLIVSA